MAFCLLMIACLYIGRLNLLSITPLSTCVMLCLAPPLVLCAYQTAFRLFFFRLSALFAALATLSAYVSLLTFRNNAEPLLAFYDLAGRAQGLWQAGATLLTAFPFISPAWNLIAKLWEPKDKERQSDNISAFSKARERALSENHARGYFFLGALCVLSASVPVYIFVSQAETTDSPALPPQSYFAMATFFLCGVSFRCASKSKWTSTRFLRAETDELLLLSCRVSASREKSWLGHSPQWDKFCRLLLHTAYGDTQETRKAAVVAFQVVRETLNERWETNCHCREKDMETFFAKHWENYENYFQAHLADEDAAKPECVLRAKTSQFLLKLFEIRQPQPPLSAMDFAVFLHNAIKDAVNWLPGSVSVQSGFQNPNDILLLLWERVFYSDCASETCGLSHFCWRIRCPGQCPDNRLDRAEIGRILMTYPNSVVRDLRDISGSSVTHPQEAYRKYYKRLLETDWLKRLFSNTTPPADSDFDIWSGQFCKDFDNEICVIAEYHIQKLESNNASAPQRAKIDSFLRREENKIQYLLNVPDMRGKERQLRAFLKLLLYIVYA